jgi:hypothetical protein
MKIVAFITDFSVVDRIINHLKLTFTADKPPPPPPDRFSGASDSCRGLDRIFFMTVFFP